MADDGTNAAAPAAEEDFSSWFPEPGTTDTPEPTPVSAESDEGKKGAAPVVPPVVEKVVPPVEKPPVVAAPPVAAPPAPAPGEVVPAKAEPAAAEPARPVETAPTYKPPTKEEILQQREGVRSQIEKLYTISEADKELLVTEPEKVLPKLASHIYLDVYEALFQTFQSMMPQYVQSVLVQKDELSSRNEAFFKRWPKLNDPRYYDTLGRFAQSYAQLYPGASVEQAIQDVGTQVHWALKIPVEEVAPAAPGAAQRPFTPALPGGAAPSGKPVVNPFTELSREFEEV